MKLKLPEPDLYSVTGGLLSLSGPALLEFLQAVLAKGASFRFKARGFSMQPFIQDGDVITVSPGMGGRWQPGDVVAFCSPDTGRLIVHRILTNTSEGWVLKGDNSTQKDGLIAAASILGRVTKVERNGCLVRLGLGPGRRLLAMLNRYGLMQPLVCRTWQRLRPPLRGI